MHVETPEKTTFDIGEIPFPSSVRAWSTVAVLMVIYVFSFVDRQILNLLVDPIKSDLHISDTQMSLLMGFSFALFYTIFGLPIGRLADSINRKGIIAVGLFCWTVATGACGLVRNYWQFLIARVGVGVGEAALSPAAYSLVADSFSRDKLARALSVYSMGIFIGAGLASGLGGWVAGWAERQGPVDLEEAEHKESPIVRRARPVGIVGIRLVRRHRLPDHDRVGGARAGRPRTEEVKVA